MVDNIFLYIYNKNEILYCYCLDNLFLWGIQPVIHKHLLKKFTAITIMLVSSIVYFALLIVTSVIKNKEVVADFEKMTAKDLGI